MSNDNSGPAFPREDYQTNGCGGQEGMTLRDYFAAHAPITLAEAWEYFNNMHNRRPRPSEAITMLANLRGAYADAMLMERAK